MLGLLLQKNTLVMTRRFSIRSGSISPRFLQGTPWNTPELIRNQELMCNDSTQLMSFEIGDAWDTVGLIILQGVCFQYFDQKASFVCW